MKAGRELPERVLFLSPHFDDVAFSCGATLHALARAGCDVTLCTVFTRSIPHPRGFALACQLDKGLGPEVDYLALRRAEDDAAAAALGATRVIRLELPEAPHRGYESAAALFGDYVARDPVAEELPALLAPLLAACDLAFVPQGLGSHVDHRRVRDAVAAFARERGSSAAVNACWYRDLPYALRHAAAPPVAGIASLPEHVLEVSDASLAAKLDACACYVTQVPFQFGGVPEMRRSLRGFARREAERLGRAGTAETFRSRAAVPQPPPAG